MKSCENKFNMILSFFFRYRFIWSLTLQCRCQSQTWSQLWTFPTVSGEDNSVCFQLRFRELGVNLGVLPKQILFKLWDKSSILSPCIVAFPIVALQPHNLRLWASYFTTQKCEIIGCIICIGLKKHVIVCVPLK